MRLAICPNLWAIAVDGLFEASRKQTGFVKKTKIPESWRFKGRESSFPKLAISLALPRNPQPASRPPQVKRLTLYGRLVSHCPFLALKDERSLAQRNLRFETLNNWFETLNNWFETFSN
ncbi:MAG: hypothetical protein LBT59_11410 [Clostridiales bacterium]|nr:hypothetical protein [Clostridiales bacterium]